MQQWDAQVVIVGAGPVGLSAALRLEATLDMLAQYGLADPLIAQGLKCEQWQIRQHETGERAVFDLSYLKGETQHPFRLQCEQFRLCRILADHLADARRCPA